MLEAAFHARVLPIIAAVLNAWLSTCDPATSFLIKFNFVNIFPSTAGLKGYPQPRSEAGVSMVFEML